MSIRLMAAMLMCGSVFSANLSTVSKGNKFNPSIGLNGLFNYQNSVRDTENDGFSLQEAELQFSSDVDAYYRAEATIAIHKEEAEEGEEHAHASYAVEPEEIFVETVALPKITMKFGKFKAAFGKHNEVHTHALPFVEKSLLEQTLLGEEGLNETGLSASYLLPFDFFSEVTLQALSGTNTELFDEHGHHSLAYLLRNKNLWELSNALTFELGLSGLTYSVHAHEDNEPENETKLVGADFTFKWRPTVKNAYKSFVWSTEFMRKERKGETSARLAGVNSYVKYQFNKRYFVQYRYEGIGLERTDADAFTNSHSMLVAFVPSEFSAIRLQFDNISDNNPEDEKKLTLQFNFSIGAHPAHAY